jgi:hypothetical protein
MSNKGDIIMCYIKMFSYYFIGCVVWFLLIGIMPLLIEDLIVICIQFSLMTIGLFVGIICKDTFYKKPWFLLFLPMLYIVLLLIISNI